MYVLDPPVLLRIIIAGYVLYKTCVCMNMCMYVLDPPARLRTIIAGYPVKPDTGSRHPAAPRTSTVIIRKYT